MLFVTYPPSSTLIYLGCIAWEDNGEYLTRLCEGSHNGLYNSEIRRRLLEQNGCSYFFETEYDTISRHLDMGRKLRPVSLYTSSPDKAAKGSREGDDMKKRFLTVDLKKPTPTLTVYDVDLEARTLEEVDSYPWLAPQFGNGADIDGLSLPIGQDPLHVIIRELGFSIIHRIKV